jgi:hypothetical protein
MEEKGSQGRDSNIEPLKAELTRIVRDHVWFSKGHPDEVAKIAERMGTTPENVLVYMIVENILEEFKLTRR